MIAATSRQAILYRNLKNPLKQTMATATHTGDIPREYRQLNTAKATSTNAAILIRLSVLNLSIKSFVFMTVQC